MDTAHDNKAAASTSSLTLLPGYVMHFSCCFPLISQCLASNHLLP